MYVCISRPSSQNETIDITSYQDSTIKQFSELIKLPNKLFSIKTPFYREKLDDDVQPFITYPYLILEKKEIPKYPIPDYCLIIHETPHPEYSIFTLINTQLEDIEFPPMEIEFTIDEFIIWNTKDFLNKCIKTFNFECTDTFLLNSENQVIDENTTLKDLYETSKTSHIIFKCTINDSSIEKVQKRKHVVEEIFDTEAIFVKNIQSLHDYWWPEFEKSEVFDRFQLRLIFKDVDPILSTHIDLLKIEVTMKKNFSTEIGPLFLNFIDRFKVAIPFVTNFKRVDDMVQKKRLSSKHFEKKFEEINENNPIKGGGDFFSYYITPIQRYPRYTLLIRDLDKCTPSFHPDKAYLELAQETLIVANKEIDETSQRVKQLLILGEIQKTLPDTFSVIKNDRNLIDRKKVTVHKKLSLKKGIIYLFNDYVLIVKKGKKKRKPLLFQKIEDFRFYNCLPSNDSILVLHKGVDITITFESYDDRVLWMDHLNQARNIHLSTINCETKFIKWTEIETGETLVPLMNLDGCCIKDKVYFFGGNNSSLMPCSALIELDLNTNVWCLKSSPVQPRIGHTMTTIGDKIYICFGFNKDHYFSDIWEFNGEQWKSIDLSTEIHLAFHTTVSYKNNLVVFGGKNENGFSNKLYFIDPSNGNITANDIKDAPSARANHSAVVFENKMVIIGGETNLVGKEVVGDVFVFNLTKCFWCQMKNACLKPRKHHRTIFLNGYIFIIGGVDGIDHDINSVDFQNLPNECIDPQTWEKVDFNEFGNAPVGISRFAIASTSKTSAITYGGIDSVTKMPFASSWMFDVEEGFYSNV